MQGTRTELVKNRVMLEVAGAPSTCHYDSCEFYRAATLTQSEERTALSVTTGFRLSCILLIGCFSFSVAHYRTTHKHVSQELYYVLIERPIPLPSI